MNGHSITAALIAAGTFAIASTAAVAAEQSPASQPRSNMAGMPGMSTHHRMMEGDKGGGAGGMTGGDMMGMMHSCQAMMGSANASGAAMMPKLPPGNEKLAFQMHAEMMQKMGEIAAKYADRVQESK